MSESTPKPWEHAKAGAGSGADPLATRFVESLSFDRRLYRHDILGSIAHARMLQRVGLLSTDELSAIERGLREIEREIEADFDRWPGWRIELEDVHMCIEAALIEKIGDPGRKLHTGRSRNDQIALDLRLWAQEAARECGGLLNDLRRAFIELAEREGRLVMPSYTHLQRAQPIVAGGELLAWERAFDVAGQRLAMLARGDGTCPLGSGAIAGSGLPIDRGVIPQLLSDLTGGGVHFDGPGPNSIEATASRDVGIDYVYALAMVAMWLSRWAEQWIIYASTEFGFITLDHRYTTGSSMMPQKRNPDMLELIRGRCGDAYGHLMALLTMCKGLTVGYNRDLQEDKRHIFAAHDTVRDAVELAARMVRTTRFNESRIADGLDRGFLDATSLADYLVTRGVPFRTAHQVVGSLVRACEQRGLTGLGQLAIDDFNAACAEAGQGESRCTDEVYDWLGPANVVRRYQSEGNAGLSGFEAQLARARNALNETVDPG